MNTSTEDQEFRIERLVDMQKNITAGMALGHADALIIRDVIGIVIAASKVKPIGRVITWVGSHPKDLKLTMRSYDEFPERETKKAGTLWRDAKPVYSSLSVTFNSNQCLEAEITSKAIQDIAEERKRQIDEENYKPWFDDDYRDGQLASAAGCYAAQAHNKNNTTPNWTPDGWPWALGWWKPKDARRDLVRAAALIVAEIERLDRLAFMGNAHD